MVGRRGASEPDLRGAIAARLRARLAVLERAIDDLLHRAHPSAERLHRLHRELRRLRVEYRLWRSSLPPAAAEQGDALDHRVAELARRVGEVRDSDVHLEMMLRPGARSEPTGTRRHRDELARRLRDDARIGRELLRAYLRAEQEAGLLHELSSSLERAAGRVGRPLTTSSVHAETVRLRVRLVRALRRARRKPSVERAHRLRILLRRSRYLGEFLATVPGAALGRYPVRLVRLQQQLGRVHDLDLLYEWVAGLAPELRDSPWARELGKRRKEARAELETELGRRALRASVERFGGG